MELAIAIRRLLQSKLLLGIGVVVAAVAGILSVYQLDGFQLKPRGGVHHSTASTQVLVDAPSSALANLAAPSAPLLPLAQTLANFAPNPAMLKLIGSHAGLAGGQLYAEGPVAVNLPRAVQEPTDLQRNLQIAGEPVPFRLQFDQNPDIPVIAIYAQAPTTPMAVKLANAAVAGLQDYVTQLQQSGDVRPAHRVVLRQLGPATGSVDSPSASKALALMAFIGTFVIWCVLILVSQRARGIWRMSADYASAAVSPPTQHTLASKRFVDKKAATDNTAAGHSVSPEMRPLTGDALADETSQARLDAVDGDAATDDWQPRIDRRFRRSGTSG